MACIALLIGCTTKDKGMNELPEISADVKKQLAFSCTREAAQIPARDREADQLYVRARWLVKKNIFKKDPTAYPPIERLLRIATAYGHDKANIELRDMLDKGQAVSPDPINESVDLVQNLIKQGIPAGYYDMGWNLEHGYGVRADMDLAFKYYRKSADMGSPEGQYWVGDVLTDEVKYGLEIAEVGLSMWVCAADQGHAKAAEKAGIRFKSRSKFNEAMKYYQIASAAGNANAANRLSQAFGSQFNKDAVYGLGQEVDPERQQRYSKISELLTDYEYLNPTVFEIEQIAPLPPATLPSWDGKFKWLEKHKIDEAPPLPTEERIAEMARAKGLDPKTGRLSTAAK